MRKEHLHFSDENLLLFAGEELSAGVSEEMQAHLKICRHCSARLEKLEKTLAEFGDGYRSATRVELPPADVARARLKARLAEMMPPERGGGWFALAWNSLIKHRRAALAGVAALACLVFANRIRETRERLQPLSASLAQGDEPDLRLTPGATVPVTINEVCGEAAAGMEPVVPVLLQRRVFELYGVMPSQPKAYEVDYLITPQLGGATDIRNLWPEPYGNTLWNAHVKDQLEDRLHEMVCRGDLDLATAQRDISTDWIGAYRKYFHVDQPVSSDSSEDFSAMDPSLPRT